MPRELHSQGGLQAEVFCAVVRRNEALRVPVLDLRLVAPEPQLLAHKHAAEGEVLGLEPQSNAEDHLAQAAAKDGGEDLMHRQGGTAANSTWGRGC